MSEDLTREEYERTLARLRERPVAAVVYYLLTGGDDGLEPEEWDFGPWHQPTMGVELRTDNGTRFSAVWGDSFDHYGLEVFPAPMSDHLVGIGTPYGPAAVDVTGHPRWAGLVGEPLTTIEVAWGEDLEGRLELPVAVRLRSRRGNAWIAVGGPAEWPPGERYVLTSSDVMVVFTAEVAATAGISALSSTTVDAVRPPSSHHP